MRTLIFAMIAILLHGPAQARDDSARDLIQRAMDHYRGQSSYSVMTMTINRPTWQRSMTMRGWTAGDKETLVRVTQPRKDSGNGTLSVDGNMWTYTPKINRVIKVPSSMMSQNWMGSDFSNKDISKNTDIIDQYDHALLETLDQNGFQVYVIESIPHEEAAVVWGKEIFHIREDWVLLEQQFWDQDNVLVKTLSALEVKQLSGRAVASILRMTQAGATDEWTELHTLEVEFDIEMPENVFTLSNLRNPRQ
ncbi:MAG: outer membrane lipoprotein-sorting protein [Halioglobus sp.]